MIVLLMTPERFNELIGRNGERQFDWSSAGVPAGTRVIVDPYLPETDDEGKPVLAWKVDLEKVEYWRGYPIFGEKG
jgi:hypothetical protein